MRNACSSSRSARGTSSGFAWRARGSRRYAQGCASAGRPLGRLEIVTGHFDQRTGPVRREWLRNNVRSVGRPSQEFGCRGVLGVGQAGNWYFYYASAPRPRARRRNDVNVKVFGNHQPRQSEWHGGFRLEVRPRGPGTSSRLARAPSTGTSQTLHRPFHSGPKSAVCQFQWWT